MASRSGLAQLFVEGLALGAALLALVLVFEALR